MVADVCKRVGLEPNNSVLDVGCGGGAFIYMLQMKLLALIGMELITKTLIDIARKAIPNGCFVLDEAVNENFSDIKFDVVLSHSVFHYFPSLDYSKRVLKNWCRKISKNGFLVLLDINDEEHKSIYHLERSKEYKSPGGVQSCLQRVASSLFKKNYLSEFLLSLGMKKMQFSFPHAASKYRNSKFRFNVICTKP